ncbi:MAG: hypothetical protein Q9O24_01595 [Gammaproteobacteria bacterium]|nr:hypothetical protein [Gammaproteobacteria bacterium]
MIKTRMLQFKRQLLAAAITTSLMVPLSAQAALVSAVQTPASPSMAPILSG